MTRWSICLSSLRHYWRTQGSVLLGLAISTAVIAGALVVGDSVRYTLDTIALDRIGASRFAVVASERFFTDDLAERLQPGSGIRFAPVLSLAGTAARPDGSARANRVHVYGVDDRFWSLGGRPVSGVTVNKHLADRLHLKTGDPVIVRVARPSALPADAPLSTESSDTLGIRLSITGIVPDHQLGRFGLQANQQAPLNVFIPLADLQERLDLAGRANLILAGEGISRDALAAGLQDQWTLADAQLQLQPVPGQSLLELRSQRVFLSPETAAAVTDAIPEAQPVLTYLVNRIYSPDNSSPYAMVTAMHRPEFEGNPQAMIVNNWLAEDLDVKPGEQIRLDYFVMGEKRNLEERTAEFQVTAVVPIKGWADDPTLMPDFPGLEDADNCRDWDPGFELELEAIREMDEAYWDMYRGTPKAFMPLEAGQRLWKNRFGQVTAFRFPGKVDNEPGLRNLLRQRISPRALGLQIVPIREQALNASSEAMNFGELFLSFSFFLIVAALLLSGMLFVFGVEQRAREIGTLLAVGYSPRTVRRMFLREGIILSILGALLGTALGTLYTRALLNGLSTIWEGAIGNTALYYHANPGSLAAGGLAGFTMALLVIGLVLRRQCRQPVHKLLTGNVLSSYLEDDALPRRMGAGAPRTAGRLFPASALLSLGTLLGAVVSLFVSSHGTVVSNTAAFFMAGTLLLLSSLFGMQALLTGISNSRGRSFSTVRLARNNLTRRKGRSLATIALLACGSFMVVAVGANRLDALRDAERKDSGTGGFSLVAESVHPVLRDLNQPEVHAFYGLDESRYQDARITQVRVKPGDDASCLNLNRAQQPRLLGITPGDFTGRFSFAARAEGFTEGDAWKQLSKPLPDGALPAVADNNSMLWAMGKKAGDRMAFTDERGTPFEVVFIAGLANSMLQGSVIVDEKLLIDKFPSLSGYNQFLIDAPRDQREALSADLSRSLQDYGMAVEPAAQRLADFNAVQNTYLSVFLVLGGLGMILGTAGLGVVVLRNVLERRSELALLRAVGFTRPRITRLIIYEHSRLLAAGVLFGVLSALLAVRPALVSPGADIPYLTIGAMVSAILVSGFLWTTLAAKLSLRGALLDALRSE